MGPQRVLQHLLLLIGQIFVERRSHRVDVPTLQTQRISEPIRRSRRKTIVFRWLTHLDTRPWRSIAPDAVQQTDALVDDECGYVQGAHDSAFLT